MFLTFVLRQLGDEQVCERVKAARTLAKALVEDALSPEEKVFVEKSLLLATRDGSPEVRLALAEVLGPSENAPEQVIYFLSRDADHIASVVVEHSPLISDAELILLAESTEEQVTEAIARRAVVSPAVSNALIAHCGAPTALALLQNSGAAILKEDVFLLARKHGDDAMLRDHLMTRDDLPVILRHQLLMCTINALQGSPLLRTTMSQKKVEALLFEAFERAAIALMRNCNDDELAEYIMALRKDELLTSQFFVRAVCQGQVRFLNEVLAQLTGQKSRRVYHILSRGSLSALSSLLKQSGLPQECQLVVRFALDLLRQLGNTRIEDPAEFARVMTENIVTQFEEEELEGTDRLLAILRRFAAEAAMDEVRGQRFPWQLRLGTEAA